MYYVLLLLGSHLYVSSVGEYEVIKDGKVLGRLGGGKAFGELAILYNCMRTASIKGTIRMRRKKNFIWETEGCSPPLF